MKGDVFMEISAIYERDLLYSTDNVIDPGCIHIVVLAPDKDNKKPIIIECRTAHSPIKYINSIIRIMQIDIFDRIHIELKNSAKIFIKTDEDFKKDFQNKNYIKVIVNNDIYEYLGVDELS